MTIIIENNENFNYLINKILLEKNPDLRDYRIILAGGFTTQCWHNSRLMEFEPYKFGVMRFLNRTKPRMTRDMSSFRDKLRMGYGDIDIWFEKDQEIKEEHAGLFDNYYDEDNRYMDNLIRQWQGEKILGLNKMTLNKSSLWANSYVQYSDRWTDTIQIIKKRPKDVYELFNDFDFENCKFAYSDERLIYTEEAKQAFNNGQLVLSNNRVFTDNTIAGKVFASLRAFKYAKRYLLDFDYNLTNLVFNIMLQAINITEEEYEENMDNGYHKSKCTKEVFFSMVDNLMNNLELFSTMEHYIDHWSAFFLNHKASRSVISNYDIQL